jgi:hypothetical protein
MLQTSRDLRGVETSQEVGQYVLGWYEATMVCPKIVVIKHSAKPQLKIEREADRTADFPYYLEAVDVEPIVLSADESAVMLKIMDGSVGLPKAASQRLPERHS